MRKHPQKNLPDGMVRHGDTERSFTIPTGVPLRIKAPAPIATILDDMLTHIRGGESARKIDNNTTLEMKAAGKTSAIMAFNIDYLCPDRDRSVRFAFSHYYKQNGDMVPDPDMEVLYFPATKELAAWTFQDYQTYDNVQPDPEGPVDWKLQRKLTAFLKVWLQNVVEQQRLDEPETEDPEEGDSGPTIKPGKTTKKNGNGRKAAPDKANDDPLTLSSFIERFKGPIAENIHSRFTPLYDLNSETAAEDAAIDELKTRRPDMPRPLFEAQAHVTKAAKTLLNDHHGRCVFVIGEMGTGKTSISNALTYLLKNQARNNLIVCPPHLTGKWEREIRETFPEQTRLQVFQIRSITDFEKAKHEAPLYDKTFFILSRERSKLSYYWKPDCIMIKKPVEVETKQEDKYGNVTKVKTIEMIPIPHCPTCRGMLIDKRTGTAYEEKQLQGRKLYCQHEYTETVQAGDNSFQEVKRKCNNPLWTADPKGPRRYALADYISKKYKNYFDTLVIDECHEYKAHGSAQGQVVGTLAGATKKTIALTGTIFGGRSSSLFYLLYRFSPAFKKQFTYDQETEFVKRYGIQWRIHKETDIQTDGRSSKRKISPTRTEEKPGISPEIILHLIDKAVFVNLQDIDDTLPPYTEAPREIKMLPDQAARYASMEAAFKQDLAKALAKGNKKLLSLYLQTCLTYPDKPLDPEIIYPKEQDLIDTVKAERSAGRKTLVYCTHTDTRDITGRLRTVLEAAGLKVEVLKAHIKAEKREAWIQEHVEKGLDVLICNPALVKTGLDLIAFPTIYYYEIDFNIYTMRQSSRRSWRIGQDKDVKVMYACYKNTMQERALSLVAKKLKAAEMIDGELQEEGLSTYKDEGSLLVEIAKSMIEDIHSENTLEGIFHAKAITEADNKGFIGYDNPSVKKAIEAGKEDIPQQQVTVPSLEAPIATPPVNDLWNVLYAQKMTQQERRTRRPQAEAALSLF